MIRISFVAVCTLATTLACQGAPEAAKPVAPAAPSAATPAPSAAASAAAATPSAAAPYTVHIAPGAAVAGKPATSVIEVRPAPGFHMNLEFPARLRVTPPAGVTVTKPDLTKDDAELTEAHLRFSVAFSAGAAGKATLAGLGDFSVCNDTTCKLIRDEKLSWDVDVKP
jgi:hypothetical protein